MDVEMGVGTHVVGSGGVVWKVRDRCVTITWEGFLEAHRLCVCRLNAALNRTEPVECV